MARYRTEQEAFWAGEFGDDYIERTGAIDDVDVRAALFAKVLAGAPEARSFIEFGAGIGRNLQAIRDLLPEARLQAVEINDKAARRLRESNPGVAVSCGSIFDFRPEEPADLVFTRGVLIHLNPDLLPEAYDRLYAASRKYICIAEYYNPAPVALDYRGHKDKLFKRDFAGEMLSRFPDLELIDYGFVYHRGPNPQDDVSWFLMRKRGAAGEGDAQ